MLSIDNLISGEKLQLLCDVIIAFPENITRNPLINHNVKKCNIKFININDLLKMMPVNSYNNPKIVFSYSNNISYFNNPELLSKFMNPFILISHNSDENIDSLPNIKNILECDKIIHWWTQNLGIPENNKISFLPIGIANKMWQHGNPLLYTDFFNSINKNPKTLNTIKTNDILFSFNVFTNPNARNDCKNIIISKGLVFNNPNLTPDKYINKLITYKMAICPVGNGLDTHRLWECFYCSVIPIVIKNDFCTNIEKYIPMIILNNWDEFNIHDIFEKYENIIKQQNGLYNLYINNKYCWFPFWKEQIQTFTF